MIPHCIINSQLIISIYNVEEKKQNSQVHHAPEEKTTQEAKPQGPHRTKAQNLAHCGPTQNIIIACIESASLIVARTPMLGRQRQPSRSIVTSARGQEQVQEAEEPGLGFEY